MQSRLASREDVTMANPRHELGLRAETAVSRWLEQSGWRIIARRFRCSLGGEVDLIAIDPASVMVAVEVRARRSGRTGIGSETIDGERLAHIGHSLATYAARADEPHVGLRIDLVILVPRAADGGWTARRMPDVGGW
ncbi:MAG: YraN family protein [Candidatus Limnocylindria bacterium]